MNHPELRNILLLEPRGGVYKHFNLILPPINNKADFGWIIMEPMFNPPMSGSNAICTTTVIFETGMKPMKEPFSDLILESPGGLIKTRAFCSNGKVKKVEIENLPSFVYNKDCDLDIPGLGTFKVDIAFGGDSFVIIDAKKLGFSLIEDEAADLVKLGDKITSLAHLAKYKEDFVAMNQQIYQEGTRVLTMGFYDPNFHDYDWKSLIKKYKPLALKASTEQDYSFVFNLLLGQLNASHMGYRAKTSERTNNDNIGLLGVEVKDISSGVQVEYVLKNSVANKSKVNLKVGDIITAVNNKPISKNTNFYSLLKNSKGEEILLTKSNGKDVIVRTLSSLRTLQYEAWVDSRRELVKKYSNGQLGYIHIRGMNTTSFESFERELKASGYGKKGIVIDVRYNGGGWTTDRLMAVLNVDQHAYTIPRGAANDLQKENKKFQGNYPFNERAILSVNTKPTVALCNENSYSNAEIFSHAYKNLGLGKLVGQPTFGAVISTGGYSLSKGYVRMPFRAWYVKKSGLNMENDAPAVPDYLVKNTPGWVARGEDTQLQKAVDVLLEEIK